MGFRWLPAYTGRNWCFACIWAGVCFHGATGCWNIRWSSWLQYWLHKVSKKLNGGYRLCWSIKDHICSFALGFVETIFSYILLNFIDTDFRSKWHRLLWKNGCFVQTPGFIGRADWKKMMEEGSKKENYSLGKALLGYGLGCIISFICIDHCCYR